MQTIRYHPLIDGDTDGREKVPLFFSTDGETILQNSKLYLSEIIPNHYRLYSKESKSRRETDQMIIQILHSSKCVYQTNIIIICHCIDRKISAAQIFL